VAPGRLAARAYAYATLLAIVAPPAIAAQMARVDDHPISGIVASTTRLADDAVRKSCPAFVVKAPPSPDARDDRKLVKTWCSVDTVYRQPTADFTRWLGAVYTVHREYPSDSTTRALQRRTRDTVRTLTAVLYSWTDGKLPWKPEWLGTVEYEYTRSISAQVVVRPDKSAFVGILYCVNGTGGCWQHFMRRRDGRWTEVVEAYVNQLPTIPGGKMLHGIHVDMATLTGSYGVYGEADGNCCPSREARITVALRGDSLVLTGHTVRNSAP
jgi:hypothetical protein